MIFCPLIFKHKKHLQLPPGHRPSLNSLDDALPKMRALWRQCTFSDRCQSVSKAAGTAVTDDCRLVCCNSRLLLSQPLSGKGEWFHTPHVVEGAGSLSVMKTLISPRSSPFTISGLPEVSPCDAVLGIRVFNLWIVEGTPAWNPRQSREQGGRSCKSSNRWLPDT